jgi:hypothetical protein
VDRRLGPLSPPTSGVLTPNVLTQYPRRLFVEDFLSVSTQTAPAAGAVVSWSHPWWWIGGAPVNIAGGFSAAPQMKVVSDGTRSGQAYICLGNAQESLAFRPMDRRGVLHMSVAQIGTAAGTRQVGFSASPLTTVVDGVYISFTNAGNLTLITRSASVSTTVSTGIAAANGIYNTVSIVCGTTRIDVYVDGVYKGTSTTNIPSAIMAFACGHSVTTTTEGLSLGFIRYEEDRV